MSSGEEGADLLVDGESTTHGDAGLDDGGFESLEEAFQALVTPGRHDAVAQSTHYEDATESAASFFKPLKGKN